MPLSPAVPSPSVKASSCRCGILGRGLDLEHPRPAGLSVGPRAPQDLEARRFPPPATWRHCGGFCGCTTALCGASWAPWGGGASCRHPRPPRRGAPDLLPGAAVAVPEDHTQEHGRESGVRQDPSAAQTSFAGEAQLAHEGIGVTSCNPRPMTRCGLSEVLLQLSGQCSLSCVLTAFISAAARWARSSHPSPAGTAPACSPSWRQDLCEPSKGRRLPGRGSHFAHLGSRHVHQVLAGDTCRG